MPPVGLEPGGPTNTVDSGSLGVTTVRERLVMMVVVVVVEG